MAREQRPSHSARNVLTALDKDIRWVDAEIAKLTTYRNGLTAARSELAKSVLATAMPTKPKAVASVDDEIVTMSRTRAVWHVLDAADRPMTANDIVAVLHEAGRTDERSSVAAAVAYLHTHGKASSTERGHWVAQDHHAQAA